MKLVMKCPRNLKVDSNPPTLDNIVIIFIYSISYTFNCFSRRINIPPNVLSLMSLNVLKFLCCRYFSSFVSFILLLILLEK